MAQEHRRCAAADSYERPQAIGSLEQIEDQNLITPANDADQRARRELNKTDAVRVGDVQRVIGTVRHWEDGPREQEDS